MNTQRVRFTIIRTGHRENEAVVTSHAIDTGHDRTCTGEELDNRVEEEKSRKRRYMQEKAAIAKQRQTRQP